IKAALHRAYNKIGSKNKVLALPPDITRFHSKAGELTTITYDYYKDKLTDILPALGTHSPMTEKEIDHMYKGVPKNLFRVHKWREDLATLGNVPSEFIEKVSEGKLN